MQAKAVQRLAGLGAAALAAALLAVPALGQEASPAPTGDPAATARPNPPRGPKADKVPEVPVTLTGRVGTRTDADGAARYTLAVGSTVYELHAGPPWWWGEAHPLAKLVGKTVTVTGERAEGSTSVDVLTVDGTAVREAGKPPWAGGWKAVGERHPGWAQWKADKHAAKWADGHPGLGRDGAPGQLKPKASPSAGS